MRGTPCARPRRPYYLLMSSADNSFDDLFSDFGVDYPESKSTWVVDDQGIKTSLKSTLRKHYVATVDKGHRHGIRRARKFAARVKVIEDL